MDHRQPRAAQLESPTTRRLSPTPLITSLEHSIRVHFFDRNHHLVAPHKSRRPRRIVSRDHRRSGRDEIASFSIYSSSPVFAARSASPARPEKRRTARRVGVLPAV